MAGLHKFAHIHEVVLYHQLDRVDGKIVGECWLLDGISKARGKAAGMQSAGWIWLRGHIGGGIWETKDRAQYEACIARGVRCIESKVGAE